MFEKQTYNYIRDYANRNQWCDKCAHHGSIHCWHACGQGSVFSLLAEPYSMGVNYCGHCDKFTIKRPIVLPLKKLILWHRGFSYSK